MPLIQSAEVHLPYRVPEQLFNYSAERLVQADIQMCHGMGSSKRNCLAARTPLLLGLLNFFSTPASTIGALLLDLRTLWVEGVVTPVVAPALARLAVFAD